MEQRIWHPSWDGFMGREDVKRTLETVSHMLGSSDFCPDADNVFRFMRQKKDRIKIVIMGMEPYATRYIADGKEYPFATGRSFEVSSVTDWTQKYKQSSLQNILKAIFYNSTGEKCPIARIRERISNGEFKILPPHDLFSSLESQGVIFLNAALTVAVNQVGSHQKLWEPFMDLLIQELDKQGVRWLLWGNDAQNRTLPNIDSSHAICSKHPRLQGFVEENCFQYIPGIDWTGGQNL